METDRFARLKALRRPAGSASAEPGGFAAAAQVRRLVSLAEENAIHGMRPDIPVGAERLAHMLGATPRANKYGEHLALRRWFSESIGCEPPSAPVNATALRLLEPNAPESLNDPEQWLFLEAGGTGTYPFLIGIAWWDAGGLEVEQFFMREHSEELSVLVALAERMAERRVLITFNGKSFVRTKSGLSHLIEGDVFEHIRKWDCALRGVPYVDVQVIDVKVVDPPPPVRKRLGR